jgi:excisionase family DNA binding protein
MRDDEQLLTIQEVSKLTALSAGTLYHWVSQKRIPVLRFSSRCIRFRRSDIGAWLAGKLIESGTPPQRREFESAARPTSRENRKEG